MKLLILIAFLTSTAFAAETKTECPWMREMMKRNNPKANMVTDAAKIKPKSAMTTGQ